MNRDEVSKFPDCFIYKISFSDEMHNFAPFLPETACHTVESCI